MFSMNMFEADFVITPQLIILLIAYSFDDYLNYILRISRDPEWLETIMRKAELNNITTQEMLHLDAVWMYEHDVLGMHR